MKITRFKFQNYIYFMRLDRKLLLKIDGEVIENRKKKKWLKRVTERYKLESGTSTHSLAWAIFRYIETKPHGRGLKILSI